MFQLVHLFSLFSGAFIMSGLRLVALPGHDSHLRLYHRQSSVSVSVSPHLRWLCSLVCVLVSGCLRLYGSWRAAYPLIKVSPISARSRETSTVSPWPLSHSFYGTSFHIWVVSTMVRWSELARWRLVSGVLSFMCLPRLYLFVYLS